MYYKSYKVKTLCFICDLQIFMKNSRALLSSFWHSMKLNITQSHCKFSVISGEQRIISWHFPRYISMWHHRLIPMTFLGKIYKVTAVNWYHRSCAFWVSRRKLEFIWKKSFKSFAFELFVFAIYRYSYVSVISTDSLTKREGTLTIMK